MKNKFEEICDDNINIFEIIINEKYNQLNDIKQNLKKSMLNTKSISKKEAN